MGFPYRSDGGIDGALVAQLGKDREELIEYFGELNELKFGARSKVPKKPDLLATYEIVTELNMPVVAGGLMDQPYIWLLQYEIVSNEVKLQKIRDELAAPKE